MVTKQFGIYNSFYFDSNCQVKGFVNIQQAYFLFTYSKHHDAHNEHFSIVI